MITVFSSSGCSVIKVKNSHFYLNVDTLDGPNGPKSTPIPDGQRIRNDGDMVYTRCCRISRGPSVLVDLGIFLGEQGTEQTWRQS